MTLLHKNNSDLMNEAYCKPPGRRNYGAGFVQDGSFAGLRFSQWSGWGTTRAREPLECPTRPSSKSVKIIDGLALHSASNGKFFENG
jgi:hypothetical protein